MCVLFSKSSIDRTPGGPLDIGNSMRRGGREAEGGGLLNRYMEKSVSWVRIPSPPPFASLFSNREKCSKPRLSTAHLAALR